MTVAVVSSAISCRIGRWLTLAAIYLSGFRNIYIKHYLNILLMRNYAKVGGKEGKPAYRTPSAYLVKKLRQLILKSKRNKKRDLLLKGKLA